MTAAHLILVWEERDDPNLLRHAERAKQVGRNPHVVAYEPSFGPSASYYAWEAAGRPVHGVRGRRRPWNTASGGAAWTLGVEEELLFVDAETLRGRARLLARRRRGRTSESSRSCSSASSS